MLNVILKLKAILLSSETKLLFISFPHDWTPILHLFYINGAMCTFCHLRNDSFVVCRWLATMFTVMRQCKLVTKHPNLIYTMPRFKADIVHAIDVFNFKAQFLRKCYFDAW